MSLIDSPSLVVLYVSAGLLGLGLWYFSRKSPDRISRELDEQLESADLALDRAARAAMEAQRLRRDGWSAVGGGLGCGIGLPLVMVLPDRGYDASMLAPVPVFLAMSLGAVLGSRRPHLRQEQQHVTSLQPLGMTSYLRRREIVGEVLLAAVGLGAVVVGARLVFRGDPPGGALLEAGIVVGGVSVGGLLWQHRMLRAPRRAGSASQVVANDIMLATRLRDVLGGVGVASAMTMYAFLLFLGLEWGIIGLGVALALGVSLLLFDHKLRPEMLPVAHRLAARSGSP